MTTETSDVAEMVCDHEQWGTDHARWLRDVYAWRKQHDHAMCELKRMQALVTHQTDAVRRHAEKIVAHEKAQLRHAKVLRESSETRGSGLPMDAYHQRSATLHDHVSEEHARLESRHRRLMEQLADSGSKFRQANA